ncbi:Crp/Fnr family transcriptional regulator [Trinickia caryophylli]|uniref:cAMP-binding domain of CRP or a regulatory subunit of cAMP-dependent protein kinases n=1 Tax=Trinickia caryophylli TaxID=28094 RepID=A0A1X7FSR9_TRICW|nr:Crp/Fnr family transcriptional regulator [Trinickia caryophylli]PMS11945.1 Crp/Fnr family transcriptional regulator [Trinickia caryophylli]TRX13977.1 Crp/Fnr family transcriptional regulator [Trinickia caryophylli]WQE15577.1 Crp/Fnr family transcriptional regulator [Trinickia caryophylli]SMF58077.1 cAMP-binding domain of CRP or a regulatory subunit of cAMP-dependent protein kinases [Trinickia caryophylli]GLU33668.1 Crp/Fnr family transcriptional regulator [Trinickia caryophylli]
MARNKVRVQDFLSRTALFNELAPAELDRLAQGTSQIQLSRGDMVFRRGDPCLGFHTVVYGQIKLSFISPLGEEKVVRLIGAGDGFGEALMFMDKPYIVSAQALADSLLLHVSKASVYAELQRDPAFACKMLASLSMRLHSLMVDVEAYSLRSGTQRVITYLLTLKGEQCDEGQRVRLEADKRLIASRLNVTPEHFSRILRELSHRDLVRISGREITIPDLCRLQEACAY